MKLLRLVLAVLLATAALAGSRSEAAPPPLILISLDGFGQDYFERYAAECPTLRRLRDEGVSAQGLIPVFPTNTFPNHYSIVTGLYPARHGIINNNFMDPGSGAIFKYNLPQSNRDSRWWGGEPVWVTAIKQGRRAATSFWVGSEAEIGGVRPTYWKPYDHAARVTDRLEELFRWLHLPADQRPALVTFYLSEPNNAGHRYGPDSPETAAAVKSVDETVSTLLRRLRSEQLDANLIIVSDHGMVATSRERVVLLDDYVDRASVLVESDGSVVALHPLTGGVAPLLRALEQVPHARAYRAEDLPAHLQLKGNPRIAPVWVLPEAGWHLALRSAVDRTRLTYHEAGYLQGDHGYDPRLPGMHGILIAHGPAFRQGVRIPALENIHVYNLMCAVVGLTPARNDGDDRLVRAALPAP